MNRKVVYSVLLSAVIITAGFIYYQSYVHSHSSYDVSADVSLYLNNTTVPNRLVVSIDSIINSSNFLTEFNLVEYGGIEGIDLNYAGQNYSTAVNVSEGHYPSNYTIYPQSGRVYFTLSNRHPRVNVTWNTTVYNDGKGEFVPAPSGYYYLSSAIAFGSDQKYGYLNFSINLPKIIVEVSHSNVSLRPDGNS